MKHEIWPAEDLETVPNCPVCAGMERVLLYDGLTDRVFGVAPGKWTLYRCNNCSSAWLDPRPNQASIGRAYETYPTHITDGDESVQPKSPLVRWLHSWLNDYKNARYGLRREPSGVGGRWLVPLLPSLRAKADAQCHHLPRPLPDGRLLDVGFGNGGFLKLAGEVGWNAEGIDFDVKAVEVARAEGLNVRCASVEELIKLDEQYDVITISHVIEHVFDPITLLKNLYRLLNPGGFFWLETPNIESSGAMRFGPNWMALDPPRHLVLFNFHSLRMSLEHAGFTNITQRWHGMVSLSSYTASEAMAHGLYAQEAVPRLIPPLQAILIQMKEMIWPAGREFLTLTARKPP